MIESINPFNQQVLEQYSHNTKDEVYKKLEQSQQVFKTWSSHPREDRAKLALNVQRNLLENIETYSQMMTLEMGKPINESRSEVRKCAWLCEYYAQNAVSFLKDEYIESGDQNNKRKSYISYQPMGTILAIMPWNFPFWQVIRFAIPTLLAGNTIIVKHASNVPQCALVLEELFEKSGFPKKSYQNILYSGKDTQKLIDHPLIKGVSLTGSTQVGLDVAVSAATKMKPCVLELGGSDPYLILQDADLDKAAKACVTSRFINSGQSCIAAKRVIVDETVYDEFIKKAHHYIQEIHVGNPLDESNQIGPLARKDLFEEVDLQVKKTIDQGARIFHRSQEIKKDSSLYPATLLIDVDEKMCAFQEEIFGPVMSIIKAKDEEHAIELANKTDFGLGAAIFSQDQAKAESIARTKLLAGTCSVNDFVKSDPRLPFGGIKLSGQGRELSHLALREFCYLKTIVVNEEP